MILPPFAPIAAHICESTLFAGVAGLLSLALRRNQARARYWIWLTASYKFLIPFSWLVSLGNLFHWQAAKVITRPIILTSLATSLPEPNHSQVLQLVIWGLWACGFLIVTAGWMREWLRVRAIACAASPLPLALPIPSASTTAHLEPGVFGIFRPILLLPAGIGRRMTQAQFEALLTHELCHVKRRDNLTAALHLVVEAIFWFHPLVWWIGTRMVDERERACDEEVLRVGNRPQVYAESILKVCELYLESPLSCISGITGSNLKKRMELIMKNHVGAALETPKKFLLAAAGLATLIVPLAIGVISVPRLSAQSSEAADRAAFDGGLAGRNEFEDQSTAGSQRKVYSAGKDGVGYPTCAYCPNPKYSDQALKAKFEGSVQLDAVITPEGRATKVKVVKAPGLGLGEKAVEAVKQWKFKPALSPDGTPVAVDVPIEVAFRLTMNRP